ncbi:ATP-binding protein [Ferrovibrio sp.]|uniref:ATP-binding protein n=1 Tax=Ferrovibrio sp. TaxID=1917215 RepID=UPI00351732B6
MRLHQLTIEGFRGYLEPTSFTLEAFTSIIGRNDVGKSTLLEALRIFFDEEKPDAEDLNVRSQERIIRISCQFEDLPYEVVLDAQARTTLAKEHLLNAAGRLEILKEYDLSTAKMAVRVFALALHPVVAGANDLLQLNNAKLKARAREIGAALEEVDERVNSDIRNSIWRHVGALNLQPTKVPLSEEDGKKIWAQIQRYLPAFALFQADRPSRDDDSEITDPLDAAVKEAVRAMEGELDKIKEAVRARVEAVAQQTLEKLREMDASLADALRPTPKAEPKWASFKFSLTDQNAVPINKRGSGVRRLILLNFFRAEAERRQAESGAPGIIYAIEEPESSQHPVNQKMLINALIDLSEASGVQVIVTTHVPGIASLVPSSGIRYVRRDELLHPRIVDVDDEILRVVADQLGVLPDNRVRLLLYVEGPTDVICLEHLSRLYGHIDLATDPRVAFVVTGGGTLKHWVNRRYLRGLHKREVHFYDRDNEAGYQAQVDEVNGRGNGDFALLTCKREIENYLHPDAILNALNVRIAVDDDCDVPLLVAQQIHLMADGARPWDQLDDADIKKKASNAKRRLCGEAASRMTLPMLQERDAKGTLDGLFRRIQAMLAE